ncbi:MAG TPA: S53 family peptidase [Caulobacteraceae bacterium]|jgi:kumamolisin
MSAYPDPQKHVVLAGSGRRHRAGSEVLGRADPNERVYITVKLNRTTPIPEPVAGAAVISRDQAISDHGADEDAVKKVAKTLADYGLTIMSEDAARRSVKASGPVERMEAIFQTHLFRVKHGEHLYRGRVGPISLPAELDGMVQGVFGLDTRPMISHRRPKKGRPAAPASQLPAPDQRAWFLPQELASAYAFPGKDGSGTTIGIIELGGKYVASDLDAFVQAAGLPGTPEVQVVNVDPLAATDANDPDAIGEVMLDVEVVAGACPGAKIVLYFSPFTERGWVDVIDAALADSANNPCVLSISYGLAEGVDIWTQQAMDVVSDAMKEAAARGIPVCVASGDDGSDDQVGDGRAHVNFPATSPYVLSVGGTALVKTGANPSSELVWFDGDGLRRDGGGSTGGGVSAAFGRPAWQASINIPSVNPGAPAGRIAPDISANAAGSTGYFTISEGQAGVSGGTSAATPLWAALISRLVETRTPVGYLTPLLYEAASGGGTIGSQACNDIVSGNNNTAAAGGYAARQGFDAVTGWGSPKGDDLAQVLAARQAAQAAQTPKPLAPAE